MEVRKLKEDIIKLESQLKELIKVAKEDIIKKGLDDLSPELAADSQKCSATKKQYMHLKS